MNALDWLVRTSWQAAALVILVILARALLGERLSPRWRHRLWWIVVARLLLPPLSLSVFPVPAAPSPASVESPAVLAARAAILHPASAAIPVEIRKPLAAASAAVPAPGPSPAADSAPPGGAPSGAPAVSEGGPLGSVKK